MIARTIRTYLSSHTFGIKWRKGPRGGGGIKTPSWRITEDGGVIHVLWLDKNDRVVIETVFSDPSDANAFINSIKDKINDHHKINSHR